MKVEKMYLDPKMLRDELIESATDNVAIFADKIVAKVKEDNQFLSPDDEEEIRLSAVEYWEQQEKFVDED